MTSAVMVQITTVSMNGSSSETKPSVIGSLVRTAEWAMAAEPTPASFENAARLKPWISAPTTPPATPSAGEGAGEDLPEGPADLVEVDQDDDQRRADIEDAHERHDLLGDPGDRLDAADDHREDDRPRRPRR